MIAVLGTGAVGRTLAAALATAGHDVTVGTRDVARTSARDEFASWQSEHPAIQLLPQRVAAAAAEVVVNALRGADAVEALRSIGPDAFAEKVLLDLAIPLDLSNGLPPTLLTANDDSLGEQIQHAFPEVFVVKSLHTMHYSVMVDPGRLPGTHSVFIGGDNDGAKRVVRGLLVDLGWGSDTIIDLGGIISARATEMYSRLFFAMYDHFGSFDFNINVVRASGDAHS